MSKVIIPGHEDKDLYDDYTELLVQKDQLEKEAVSYQIAYTQEFGELICANFELKIQCIKVKKSISYCRRRLNRGLAVDPAKMDEEIEREMKAYYLQRDELQKDYAEAKKAGMTDGITYMRAKKIYRRLAKLLHPDINEKTQQNAELSDLWLRIVNHAAERHRLFDRHGGDEGHDQGGSRDRRHRLRARVFLAHQALPFCRVTP